MKRLDEHSNEYNTYIFSERTNTLYKMTWDGCVHIWQGYNGVDVVDKTLNHPGDEDSDIDYIHICNLEEFVEDLQNLDSFRPERYQEWDR